MQLYICYKISICLRLRLLCPERSILFDQTEMRVVGVLALSLLLTLAHGKT
jgi:hypothetical protein